MDGITEIAGEVTRIVNEFNTKSADWSKNMKESDSRIATLEQLVAQRQKHGATFERTPPLADAIRSKFVDSSAMADFRSRGVSTGAVDLGLNLKTLVSVQGNSSSSSDWDVSPSRITGPFGYGMRDFSLFAALPVREIETNRLETHQLNGFVAAAAAQTAEGAEKAEQTIDPVLTSFPVSTVAVFMTISRQLADDDVSVVEMMRGILGHTVIAKAERDAVYGTGTNGEMRGLFTDATTHSVGGDSLEDEIGDCAAIMAANGYAPSVVVLNPIDWRAIQRRKAGSDGHYLMGSPAAPIAPSLWNMRVAPSPAIDSGDALVIDARYVTLLDRMKVTAFLGFEDNDNLRRNIATLLIEGRWGVALLDTAAAYKIVNFVDPSSGA